MFDLLFKRPATVRRHLEAPYVQERQQYLAEQARQGNTHSTLQFTAQDLLWIACKLSIYPDLRTVTMEQVRARADDWKKRERACGRSLNKACTRQRYFAFKRALGVRLESEAGVLRAFCRSVGDTNVEDVKPAAVLAFIAGKGPVTRSWKQKASVLRSFYRYAVGRGHATGAPLPSTIPKFPPMRTPHIYSTDELKQLLRTTEMLDSPRAPLRALAYRTLLLLLYGTGMRLNEALVLTLNDVDLTNRLITVRNTKFFKTRWVPIGPKLTSVLADYARRRVRTLPMPSGRDSIFFGTARSGTRWHCAVAEELFRRLRKRAAVCREGDARNQPRLHDIRHTATQHRLIAWYRSGQDVQRLLPQLATYLGHVDLSSTQYYIAMTPELLRQANLRFERYAQPGNLHA